MHFRIHDKNVKFRNVKNTEVRLYNDIISYISTFNHRQLS